MILCKIIVITPKLAVIEQPLDAISGFAGETLLRRICNGKSSEPESKLIDGVLIEGESVVGLSALFKEAAKQ